MRRRYITNAAFLNVPGSYDLDGVSLCEARLWYREAPVESMIVHDVFADLAADMLDVPRPPIRKGRMWMERGDEALVVVIKLPAQTRKVLMESEEGREEVKTKTCFRLLRRHR